MNITEYLLTKIRVALQVQLEPYVSEDKAAEYRKKFEDELRERIAEK